MANYVSSREVLPFIYTVDITISSLSGTGTKTLVLGADSEFELYGFEARTSLDQADQAGAVIGGATALNSPVQAPDNFKILVKDISTGRDLFTNALNRSLICGNSSNLFVPEGYRIRFPRQNQLQFDFTNLYTAWPTGASSMDITFALRGYKIFGQMG
jgi:hypothetical protein